MKQIQVTACHGDTINRVIQSNRIQPGNMIEYLESRLHYIMFSESDLRQEVAMGCADQMEPGFYEKLFAELGAEVEMVKSIIAKLKEVQCHEEMMAGVKKRMAEGREAMKGGV